MHTWTVNSPVTGEEHTLEVTEHVVIVDGEVMTQADAEALVGQQIPSEMEDN